MNALPASLVNLLEGLPLGRESTCPYYPERRSRLREFQHEGDLPPPLFRHVLQHGYRRCGWMYYQTHCATCRQCLSYRLSLATFAPSRNQRRVLARNRDVVCRVGPPTETLAKRTLYLHYKHDQHHLRPAHEPAPAPFNAAQEVQSMRFQMYTNPSSSLELTLWLGDELLGFGTLDVAGDCVSAVYFAFAPAHRARSLGTLAILRGTQWAQEQGFAYYHLGFFLPGHPKMDYKHRFQPAEILDRTTASWVPYSTAVAADFWRAG